MTKPAWFKYLTPTYMKQVIKDKQEYKAQIARMQALPKDYQKAYKAIQTYMLSNATGDGMDTMNALFELIDFFTEGAENGIAVRELIGTDVAAFVDDMLKERGVKTWQDTAKDKLNRALSK